MRSYMCVCSALAFIFLSSQIQNILFSSICFAKKGMVFDF